MVSLAGWANGIAQEWECRPTSQVGLIFQRFARLKHMVEVSPWTHHSPTHLFPNVHIMSTSCPPRPLLAMSSLHARGSRRHYLTPSQCRLIPGWFRSSRTTLSLLSSPSLALCPSIRSHSTRNITQSDQKMSIRSF